MVRRVARSIAKILEKAEKDVRELIENLPKMIEDAKIRRIVRNLIYFCIENGGTPRLSISGREYPTYTLTCMYKTKKFTGVDLTTEGGTLFLVGSEKISTMEIPHDWFLHFPGKADFVKGFIAELRVEPGSKEDKKIVSLNFNLIPE